MLAATDGAEPALLGLAERLAIGAVCEGSGTLDESEPTAIAEGDAALAESCALTAPDVTLADAVLLTFAVGRLALEADVAAFA